MSGTGEKRMVGQKITRLSDESPVISEAPLEGIAV